MFKAIVNLAIFFFVIPFSILMGWFLVAPLMLFFWDANLYAKLGLFILCGGVTIAAFSERFLYGVLAYIVSNFVVIFVVQTFS